MARACFDISLSARKTKSRAVDAPPQIVRGSNWTLQRAASYRCRH